MDGLTASRIAGGNTAYSRNKQDLYPTPPEVTYALLDFLALPCGTRIWEPACGNGDMVREMETWGYQVTGTDISMGQDFLTVSPVPCDWIITNPPFSLSEEFIRRCRYIGKPFALRERAGVLHADQVPRGPGRVPGHTGTAWAGRAKGPAGGLPQV